MINDICRRLSSDQRDMLIDHIDCIVPVDNTIGQGHGYSRTRKWLLAKRLLKTHPPNTTRPTGTSLTDIGRQVVCHILGECAESLIRAGLLELDSPDESPLEVLRRLRSERVIPRFAGNLYPKRPE